MSISGTHFAVGVFLLSLSACASAPQTRQALKSLPESLSRQVELKRVPFFSQEVFQCGPSSLAMSLHAAGIAVTPDVLGSEVYLPEMRGSLQVEMISATRRHGAVAYQLAPELKDVLHEVATGTPVVVLQNLAFNWYPMWHYAVVVGYDLDRAEVILRSGREERQVLSMSTFEHTWSRSNRWAMVAVAPEVIPETAESTAFLEAVSAFEMTNNPVVVQAVYAAASRRWPDNVAAQIGVGNAAYRSHDLVTAETVFRRISNEHPESVAALNNLANTLSDQKRYKEAEEVAHRAVRLGGPLLHLAQDTLLDIEKKRKP
ncbi:MAG: PA2778 family cysteine peptidase [Candidatus Nitrotoga sp.]|nr:PA2778 family cysteine peptidase [Candidatus Nitrotoga sp.]